MGHDEHCRALLRRLPEAAENKRRVLIIQIPRRLICEDDLRSGAHGSRNGGPTQFSAGELRCPGCCKVFDLQQRHPFCGAVFPVIRAIECSGQQDVLLYRQRIQHAPSLRYYPDRPIPEPGELPVRQPIEVRLSEPHLSFCGCEQAGEHMQQGRLPGSASSAEDCDGPGLQLQAHCLHGIEMIRFSALSEIPLADLFRSQVHLSFPPAIPCPGPPGSAGRQRRKLRGNRCIPPPAVPAGRA